MLAKQAHHSAHRAPEGAGRGDEAPRPLPQAGALLHPASVLRRRSAFRATGVASARRYGLAVSSTSGELRVTDDAAAMQLALEAGTEAGRRGEVPVGAVVVRDGAVLALRGNEREAAADPTAHAEVLALRDAAQRLGRWRLDDCTLVVTLEPCPMCAGALWAARLGRVVFGASDLDSGAVGSRYNIAADVRLNHETAVTAGVLAEECAALLQIFFAERRL